MSRKWIGDKVNNVRETYFPWKSPTCEIAAVRVAKLIPYVNAKKTLR